MRSSILAWRTPLPDREAWRASVHMVTKSWTQLKQLCMYRCKTFFAFGSSAPVNVKCKGSTAAWTEWTLMVPNVQRHGLSQLQELWPHQSYGPSLWQLVIRRPLWLVFLCHSACSAVDAGMWEERGYGNGFTCYA